MPNPFRKGRNHKPKQTLQNLRRIKQNLAKVNVDTLLPHMRVSEETHTVEATYTSLQELQALEQAIDSFTQKADQLLQAPIPMPNSLERLAKNLAQNLDNEELAFAAPRLKSLLQQYHNQIDNFYLGQNTWYTPDNEYQPLLQHPNKFSPKSGGAKNTGKRTGVYSFQHDDQAETILIKQGANLGETIAEYVGANLYGLTIPEYSARCILVRDNLTIPFSANDIYLGSVYEKADHIQDGFQAAGYESRGMFAGEKARVKAYFNNDDSLIRKMLDINAETGHTLEYAAANALWHGDSDFHTGNVILAEKNQRKKFIKIDHGFSFFNLGKKVIDVFNPFAGKVMSFSPKRQLTGGKLLEFYPTNHFWDYAVENKQFYYNATFVKACEDIVAQDVRAIRDNVEKSLINVQTAYGPHAVEALHQFALRLGMKESDIKLELKKKNPELLRFKIEDHILHRLTQRQTSIAKLAEHCKKQTAKLDKNRYLLSKQLNKLIIKKLDHISNDQLTVAETLLKEIEVLKLIQQANDLAIIKITPTGALTLKDEFYFHHNGQRRIVTPEAFSQTMALLASQYTTPKLVTQIQVNDDTLALLRQIRLTARDEHDSPKKIRRP